VRKVVQDCTLAVKYIIREFEGLDNVSHFTKIDDNGHIRESMKNRHNQHIIQTKHNPKSICEYYHHLLVTFDNAFIFAHAVL